MQEFKCEDIVISHRQQQRRRFGANSAEIMRGRTDRPGVLQGGHRVEEIVAAADGAVAAVEAGKYLA